MGDGPPAPLRVALAARNERYSVVPASETLDTLSGESLDSVSVPSPEVRMCRAAPEPGRFPRWRCDEGVIVRVAFRAWGVTWPTPSLRCGGCDATAAGLL